MKITRKSLLSGITRTRELPITAAQLAAWGGGVHAQNAFPNLSASDREFIMTGITAEEWDAEFKEPEDRELDADPLPCELPESDCGPCPACAGSLNGTMRYDEYRDAVRCDACGYYQAE